MNHMPETPETPVTLAELVAEGFGASVYSGPNTNTLARYLASRGIAITLDDLGRRIVARVDARQLFAERAEQQAAARERDRAEHERRNAHDDAIRAGLRARERRQRAALRDNRDLGARDLMMMDSGDAERRLDRVGNTRDQLAAAERRGELGYGRFGKIPAGE